MHLSGIAGGPNRSLHSLKFNTNQQADYLSNWPYFVWYLKDWCVASNSHLTDLTHGYPRRPWTLVLKVAPTSVRACLKSKLLHLTQFVLKFSYWAPSRPGTWQEKESTRRQCPFESSWTDCHLFNTIAKQHSLVVLGHDCDAAAIHRSWAWILLLHTSLDPQWPESEGCLESASPIHWPRKLRDFHNFIRLPCVSGDDRSQTSILANWSGGNSFKAAAISSGVLPSIAVLASWRCWLGVSWAVPFRSPYQDSGHVGDRLAALKDSIKTHW